MNSLVRDHDWCKNADQPRAQNHAQYAAADGAQQALHKELANHPSTARPERLADGKFALPRRASSKQQVRHVCASD